MLKKITAVMLTLAILLGTGVLTSANVFYSTAFAAFEVYVLGDYKYTFNDDNTVRITAYTGTDKNVVVPSQIEGVKVTKIAFSAFKENKTLESITIPDSVTDIANNAFCKCIDLKSVKLGKNVRSIGAYAFDSCTGLTEIVIPDSVTALDTGAFARCSNLKSITLSKNIKWINGLFPECTSLESVVIPQGVYYIGAYSFRDCKSLKSIDIPSSMKIIGYEAFFGCTGIDTITIPASVTKIDKKAFGYKYIEGTTYSEKIDGFKIITYKGSAGEDYAKENGIAYEYVKPSEYIGNVNGDGKIDIADLTMVLNHINGVKSLTPDQMKRADSDGSGTIDIRDASKIANHINGINSLF